MAYHPPIDTRDERMHPVGDAPAWSESYYFNYVDPDTQLAMFTRMGWRPGDRWADGLHAVYLGGDRVAFTYGRREIGRDLGEYDGALSVGGLTVDCIKPFEQWRVAYDGPAQDIADAAILLERSKLRPPNWFTPATLRMAVNFDAISTPHYSPIPDGAPRDRGHFEQTGRVHGEIEIGGVKRSTAGFGVRDKSWGPRDWGAGSGGGAGSSSTRSDPPASASPAPFVNWFSMNFGPDLAMGGACGRDANGELRGAGWLNRDGKTVDLENVRIVSRYKPGSILHTDIRLTGTAAGRDVDVEGKILTICPTKIPMAGGATFVNEGLARFTTEGKTGFGISEHWHKVAGAG